MFYFNISPYLTPSLTLSVTSSLSARMTDLFSAFSPLCLCFILPHLGCVVQHFDSEVCWTIHNPWLIQLAPLNTFFLQPVDSGSPLALSASAALLFLLAKYLYLSNTSKRHLDNPTSLVTKSGSYFPSWPTQDFRSYILAKRHLLKWMTLPDLYANSFSYPL